jgi:DNA-binding response OmpR family regulator
MARILLVEDESDIAQPLAEDLEVDGHQVEIAAEGDKALRRACEEAWDLILLDVMLPRKDGFEVCRELRRSGVRTPIILLTAKTAEAEK